MNRSWAFHFRILAVLAVLGIAAFPVYWMAVTSMTSSEELFAGSPRLLPDPAQIGTYARALVSTPLLTWLGNSLIIALGTTALSLLLAILPAYALSRMSFRGKLLLALGLFVTQMLPEAMLVVPLYDIFSRFALLDSLTGLILANTAFAVPVVTWILKGAIDGIPTEIEEAARIDGCSRVGIVLTIVLPLIAPTLAAVAVIAFFQGWNEYVFAQTFISDESLKVASVGLASFVGELSTPMDTVMAVGLTYTLPAVVFYLLVQRYIVAGVTSGGVKG